MSKVRKSIFLSFGQTYVNFVLQFGASVIIARLLMPAEIGIFSVAMVLIGFAHRLRDFGAASYVIQEKELTPDKIRAAFSMTLFTAWVMAAVIGLGSGYAAVFYHEPGVRSVMLVLCINFILLPFGTVPMAYMQRQMNFRHIALINVSSNAISTVTSVSLAYMGFSYLSLAWGAVAGIVCNIVLAQIWRPKELPMFPGIREIRQVFSFGSLSSFVMILSDLTQGAPDLILGRLSGMSVVGYFGRAMGLVSMFDRFVMSALWSVVLPHFAEQSRKEAVIKGRFLNSIAYITVLAWPFFVCLGLLASPIILVLYGKQWEPSIPLLQLLCISMIPLSPFLLMSTILTGIGQMKQNLYILIIHSPIHFVLLYLAAPFGLKTIGAMMIVSNLIGAAVLYYKSRTILFVRLVDVAMSVRESAGVALTSAILPVLMLLFGDGFLADKHWLTLILGLTGSILGWLVGLFLCKHPFRVEVSNSILMVRQKLVASR